MKRFSKVLLVVLVVGVVFSSSLFVSAGTPREMTSEEANVLARLNEGFNIDGSVVKIPDSYINAFRNYCENSDNAPIEAAKVTTIIDKIDELEVLIDDNNTTETFTDGVLDLETLPQEVKTQCASVVNDTVSAIDETVKVVLGTATTGKTSIIVEQTVAGKVNTIVEEPIKQTGNSVLTSTMFSVAAIALIAVAVIAASKMKLFA